MPNGETLAEQQQVNTPQVESLTREETNQLWSRGCRDVVGDRRDTPAALFYIAYCKQEQAEYLASK